MHRTARPPATIGLGLLLTSLAFLGCNSAAVHQCQDEMAAAQGLVLAMKAGEAESVNGALMAIRKARASCEAAGRGAELKELAEADANLAGHLQKLTARATQGSSADSDPAQLAELKAHGDPSCPKGHVYTRGNSKDSIRCTGPQLCEMNFAEVKQHYAKRGFTVAVDPEQKRVRAEYGAEVDIFDFAEPNSTRPAVCSTLVAPPGIAWQEVVTRATGVAPQRLSEGKPVTVGSRTLPVRLEGPGPDKTVLIGACPAPETAAPKPSVP